MVQAIQVKCKYCGTVFFVHQEKTPQEQEEEDFAAKAAAFEDSINHTGGQEQYPQQDQSDSKIKDYCYWRAAVAMLATALLPVIFSLLSINAFSNRDSKEGILLIFSAAISPTLFYVSYRFLPKDQGTPKASDYVGD